MQKGEVELMCDGLHKCAVGCIKKILNKVEKKASKKN